MSENEKNIQENEITADENVERNPAEAAEKKAKGKSFMDVYREVNKKEREEELKRQSELEAERAEKERHARDEYAEKLRQERLELLKLKQGIISEDDIPKEEKVVKEYTTAEKIGNFFYHNKLYIIFGSIIVAILGFLIIDSATTVRPDVSIIFTASDANVARLTGTMEDVLACYCSDYNGDGKIKVRVSYTPAVPDTDDTALMYYQESDQTKLMAEFQGSETIIIIGDDAAYEALGITEEDVVFADMSEYFQDDKVTPMGYLLNTTNFAEDIEYDGLSDDIVVSFRKVYTGVGVNEEKFQKNFDNAVELWTNYVNGNMVDPNAVNAD